MDDINSYLKRALNIRQSILNGDGDFTWQDMNDLREEFNMPNICKDNIRKGFLFSDELMQNGWIAEPNLSNISYKETSEINNNGTLISDKLISLNEKDKKDPNTLLKAHGFDTDVFELVSAKNSIWQQGRKDGVTNLYASKITVKTKEVKLNYEDMQKHFENYSLNHKETTVDFTNYEYGAEYLVPTFYDVHFGRLCGVDETSEKYDSKIAKDRVLTSVNKYISKFSGRKFEKIFFIIGQDFLNASSNGFTTSGAHRQDMDSRYATVFKRGTETLIEAIEKFSVLAPVNVVLVQGNHSTYEEFYMACLIATYFKDSKRVSVDDSPMTRKYLDLGATAIGLTHGSEEKDRIFGLMQYEAPDLWAKAKTRMFLVGHIHHMKVEEKNGVEVWSLPTLVSGDAWSVKSGYTTARKRTMAFIFDKESGLTETHYINI